MNDKKRNLFPPYIEIPIKKAVENYLKSHMTREEAIETYGERHDEVYYNDEVGLNLHNYLTRSPRVLSLKNPYSTQIFNSGYDYRVIYKKAIERNKEDEEFIQQLLNSFIND